MSADHRDLAIEELTARVADLEQQIVEWVQLAESHRTVSHETLRALAASTVKCARLTATVLDLRAELRRYTAGQIGRAA